MHCILAKRLLVLLATLLLGSAFAYDGFTVGLGTSVTTASPHLLDIHAAQPLWTIEHASGPTNVSARFDIAVATSFDALPSAGAALILSDASDVPVRSYFGAGIGVTPPQGGFSSMVVSGYGLIGYRAPITRGLQVALEGQVSTSRLGINPAVAVFLDYQLGGRR